MSQTASSIRVFIGGRPEVRAAAVDNALRGEGARVHEVSTAAWPFARRVGDDVPADRVVLFAPQLHAAFPAGQTGSTRLVLTQSSYQLQRWIDWMDRHANVALIAEADAASLREAAPEAFHRRGPWASVEFVELGGSGSSEGSGSSGGSDSSLYRAFSTKDPDERLALCRRAAEERGDDVVAQLALGGALMEVQDLEASQAAIERAIALSPDWEAAHHELGKLFLRLDDLERASRAFAEAGRLMPSLSAAFSNLGATLGELDRPGEALAAFEQAVKYDPNGYTVLNNIGVVSRELGRLGESEAAFRKVTTIAPHFVFGHYNLGHTLFLQGRYQAALSAYMEGQRRDPEKNPRQACRLAVVRLAAGDPEGSLRDLQRFTAGLPAEQKREILAEAQEILWALLTDRPALGGWRHVADAVKSQLEALR